MREPEVFFDPDAVETAKAKPARQPRPNSRETGAKDPLLPRLEAAMAKLRMSATAFSYVHFSDPAFMKKLREGRRLYKLRKTAERVCKDAGV